MRPSTDGRIIKVPGVLSRSSMKGTMNVIAACSSTMRTHRKLRSFQRQIVFLWTTFFAAVLMLLQTPCRGEQLLFASNSKESLLLSASRPAAFAAMAESHPLETAARIHHETDGTVLPEAPLPQQSSDPQQRKALTAADPVMVSPQTQRPIVTRYSKYIPAGAAAPQIHGREKLVLGARDLYSPGNFLDMVFSAGWEHLTNSEPNYGTNSGAFAQRVGAAALRETSGDILTDGVFSVMLHEDPRYFVLGPEYGYVHRTLYAITRPLVTRNSSDGHATINGAMILGFAGSSALTATYYPQSNRNFHDVISTFGGSFGGAALGFFIDEFSDQALEKLHLKKKP